MDNNKLLKSDIREGMIHTPTVLILIAHDLLTMTYNLKNYIKKAFAYDDRLSKTFKKLT